MLKKVEQPKIDTDGSALVTRGIDSEGDRHEGKQRPWCDHCRRPWHTRETCWKLHGEPENWKKKPGGDAREGRDSRVFQANNTYLGQQSSLDSSPFTKEQMEHLYKIFQS